MTHRVLVLENDAQDLSRFEKALKGCGCDVLLHPSYRLSDIEEGLRSFAPDFAIVDSRFDDDIDGAEAINNLSKICPGVPVIVCTCLLDSSSKRHWIRNFYKHAPGVVALVGKDPFPTGEELLSYFSGSSE